MPWLANVGIVRVTQLLKRHLIMDLEAHLVAVGAAI